MDVTKCLHISLCLTVFLDVAVSAYSQSRLNNLRDDDLVTAAPSLSIATLRVPLHPDCAINRKSGCIGMEIVGWSGGTETRASGYCFKQAEHNIWSFMRHNGE